MQLNNAVRNQETHKSAVPGRRPGQGQDAAGVAEGELEAHRDRYWFLLGSVLANAPLSMKQMTSN